MSYSWRKYQGTLLCDCEPHREAPSKAEAIAELRKSKAMFVRYTSDFDCGFPTEWWYCICDCFTPLDKLTAKQRYRVKKGLSRCNVEFLESDKQLTDSLFEEIYAVVVEAFSDYPLMYRPNILKEDFRKELLSRLTDKAQDVWLIKDAQDIKLIGYGYVTKKQTMVYLNQVKIPTKYLDTEANAAFAYKICEYYLNGQKYKYICDGERNIKHRTNYQEFLVRVLNFRYAYCRLNIFYSFPMKIAVNILYPFRNIIKHLGKHSAFLYNVYCVLKQENIHRNTQKAFR